MKRTITRLLAAVVTAVAALGVVASGVHAQQPPAGGPGVGADPLNLTAAQKKKLEAIQKKYQPLMMALQKKWKPKFDAIQKKYQKEGEALAKDTSPAGQKKQQALMLKMQADAKPILAKAMKEMKPLQDKATKEMNAVLTPQQQATLKKLMAAQQGGPGGPGG